MKPIIHGLELILFLGIYCLLIKEPLDECVWYQIRWIFVLRKI